MEERDYSVSEAVRLIGVESHVLRYWEEELQLEIRRNSQGHRIYGKGDIEMFRRVRDLREKGLQLKAIRLLLVSRTGADGQAFQKQAFRGQKTDREELSFGSEELFGFIDGDAEEDRDEGDMVCEVIPVGGQENELYLFERILRRLIGEVVSEQNEKLEASLAGRMREELEDFYLQYARTMQEAAASAEQGKARFGKLGRALRRLLRTER